MKLWSLFRKEKIDRQKSCHRRSGDGTRCCLDAVDPMPKPSTMISGQPATIAFSVKAARCQMKPSRLPRKACRPRSSARRPALRLEGCRWPRPVVEWRPALLDRPGADPVSHRRRVGEGRISFGCPPASVSIRRCAGRCPTVLPARPTRSISKRKRPRRSAAWTPKAWYGLKAFPPRYRPRSGFARRPVRGRRPDLRRLAKPAPPLWRQGWARDRDRLCRRALSRPLEQTRRGFHLHRALAWHR